MPWAMPHDLNDMQENFCSGIETQETEVRLDEQSLMFEIKAVTQYEEYQKFLISIYKNMINKLLDARH